MAVLLQTEAAEGDGDEGEDTKLHMVSTTHIDTECTAETDGIGGRLLTVGPTVVTIESTRCAGLMAEQ